MSVTSPLTSAESLSTPESYTTAKDSPFHEADTTGISSPVVEDRDESPRFRHAVHPIHELKGQCQIQLEEELCKLHQPNLPSLDYLF